MKRVKAGAVEGDLFSVAVGAEATESAARLTSGGTSPRFAPLRVRPSPWRCRRDRDGISRGRQASAGSGTAVRPAAVAVSGGMA